ncbi:MAG: PP2C family protein-serine/threonine phosphatase [Solirubrobacteraceae bacterium]
MQGAAQRPWNASDDLADDFEPSAEPRRVLVIEDDDEDAMIVSDLLLEAWPTLGIARASALGEAERALGADIDCVLVDLGLPDAYGLEAVQRLREADPEMPVVVLTGDSDEQRGIQALGAGAQDYLIKGTISGASLARAIRHSVQRKLAERFQRELAVLRVQSAENARVQRGLVPHPLVDDPHVSVVSAYRPGNRRQVLGGDFFDVVQSSPGHLHVLIGDVCGHGPDEATLGVELRIAWRTLILAGVPQPSLIETLDRLLVQERHADHIFTTLAWLSIDLAEGRAATVLAGHPPPILLGEDGVPRLVVDHPAGPPLGLGGSDALAPVEVEIGASWSLLMYSDGIYEGRVGGAHARLGIDGLVELLRRSSGSAATKLDPERLIDQIEELNQGPLDDDVALLALTRDPRGG